ncbi:diacylglycerol acyltransferase-domain-containing protein [Peziza echinospora]|nr:diacylglycerol acyltransferase-domain-containing protein [Peziza echinospora]
MMSSPPTTPPRTQKKVRTGVGEETPSHPSSPADSQLDGGEYGANGGGADALAEKVAAEEDARYAAEAGAAAEATPTGWLTRIRLAPLHVPLRRRLETLAVLWHELALGLALTLFWSSLANPFLWPLLLPYLLNLLLSSSHQNGSSPHIRSEPLRALSLWKYYNAFFPITIHRTTPLDPTGNYIFGYQPHGIISIGAWGSFVTDDGEQGDLDLTNPEEYALQSAPGDSFGTLFPGIKNTLLTLDGNFRIPFYREYLLAMGLGSVSRRSCEALLSGSYPDKNPLPPHHPQQQYPNQHTSAFWSLPPLSYILWAYYLLLSLLPVFTPSFIHPHLPRTPTTSSPPSQTGNAITIVLGGAHESLLTLPHTYRLILRRRRGFLKLALRSSPRHPVSLVPVLAFGENDLYTTLIPKKGGWLYRWQHAVKRWLGFTVPVFWARGIFNYDVGLVPFRRRVDVVVGRPVLPRRFREGEDGRVGRERQEVTEEEVDELQEEYVAELERLWDEWKDVFAKGRKGELEIVE